MEAWFLSDIHLRSHEERNGQILLRFLHSLVAKDPAQTQLFLLGDIFDLWVGPHFYFAKKFRPFIEIIRQLRTNGMKIVYIEGNHDVHVEGFFQKRLGVQVFAETQFVEINGLTLRLEHGDLINLDDHAYLRYRSIIRNPFVKPLGNIFPGIFWDYFGTLASKKSRAQSGHFRVQNEEKLVHMIRNHAAKSFSERPFDVIISGHMHVFDDYAFVEPTTGKKVRSINLGSWFEDTVRVLCLNDQELQWVTVL